MKGIISEWGGTKGGILYALAALGYEESYIEPVAFHDSERLAEFIVFLGGKNPSGVNDLDIIDAEVRKVKEGSSRPEYGLEEWNAVEIREWSRIGLYDFPICGRLRCGQYPGKNNNVGYLLRSRADIFGSGCSAANGSWGTPPGSPPSCRTDRPCRTDIHPKLLCF